MKFVLTSVIGAVLMLSIATACQPASSPTSITKMPETSANSSQRAPEANTVHADDDAPRIALADAKKDFDAGTAIFVDTRDAGSYELEHIKGAINVPASDLKEKIKTIPTDKKIIAYCS